MLQDEADVIDVITKADALIGRGENFPVEGYESLLHMVYNPIENRFYKQVAITAYTKNGRMLNIRENLESRLPEDAIIILIPTEGCISDWEEPINYKEFLNVIQKNAEEKNERG
jgi:hypothetical protein